MADNEHVDLTAAVDEVMEALDREFPDPVDLFEDELARFSKASPLGRDAPVCSGGRCFPALSGSPLQPTIRVA
jgi:hypothetical protein